MTNIVQRLPLQSKIVLSDKIIIYMNHILYHCRARALIIELLKSAYQYCEKEGFYDFFLILIFQPYFITPLGFRVDV